MVVYMNRAARPKRNPAKYFFAGLCLFTVLAFAPQGVGAATPAGAVASPGVARAPDLSAGSSASPGASRKAVAKPEAQAGKEKAQPAEEKKIPAGKTGKGKPVPKKAAKPRNAPAAKPAMAAAGKPEGLSRKDGALKMFPVCNVPPIAPAEAANLPVADTWQPLAARLAKDGVEHAFLRSTFGRLGDSYSHVPMGTKINELFFVKFMPKPVRPAAVPGKSDTPPVYKWALKPENVLKCEEYLKRHKDAFAGMEIEYGIPREIVAGLLLVETRLGTYLGASSSFWSLACLAAADTPDRVAPVLQALPLPMTPEKMEWVSTLVRERSAWAYRELLALVKHCRENDLDPLVMPGSVYGAVGICQFMPSNLSKFAVDGNKDGKIDLFEPADAIPSVGNYLKKHGWRNGDREASHQVIKKYNKSTVYANTILALAEALSAPPAKTPALPPGGGKVASGTKAAAGQKGNAEKSGAGKAPREKATGGKISPAQNTPKAAVSPEKAKGKSTPGMR